MTQASLLAAIALGYLLGSIPFGLVLTRAAGLGDVRKIGSGSIGATNVLRTGHKGLAAMTVLLDGGKGVAAVLIGATLAGPFGVCGAGLAAVLGHAFPVWLGFKGGKSVATGFGVLLAANPIVGLATAAIWLAVAAVTRISSVAALAACLAAPLITLALGAPSPILTLVLIAALLIVLRHRGNIERLIKGTEPRIGEGK